jgi:hypothetical protein
VGDSGHLQKSTYNFVATGQWLEANLKTAQFLHSFFVLFLVSPFSFPLPRSAAYSDANSRVAVFASDEQIRVSKATSGLLAPLLHGQSENLLSDSTCALLFNGMS